MKKILCTAVAAMLLYVVPQQALAASLIPVGQVIGLSLSNGSVSVAAFDEALGGPAQAAGLQVGDQILSIDGQAVDEAADIHRVLSRSGGQVDLTVRRKDRQIRLTLSPQITEEGPRLGVHLKQGVTGLGTVTWYDPQTGRFGALGHGVSDGQGALVSMTTGTAYAAAIASVKKGQCGQPGQLRGSMDPSVSVGTLDKNTQQGLFGTADTGWTGQALQTAAPDQIRTGQATIVSTVSGQGPREYSVQILRLYPDSRGRDLLLRVDDPALLEATGGIVQGMSGSPILQDGKLIGAVTHVLVNDPTTGYGIFIDHMLEAAA